ncbi:MAG: PepSY-associated TM helix domain-containing protein [Chitinophagaceae bacterium]|nr:PepSY-associated TM helix domain-containing protein [Chitinophagaceae bacterium]
MATKVSTKIRRLNIATHRDLGYFFSTLIVVYCLSGLALNHIDEWNPDFIITKQAVPISPALNPASVDKTVVESLGKLVGETKYKVFDVPTPGQVKVYYDNASFHVNFTEHKGLYERVARRPVFYHSNLLHRNSVKGWKWMADFFAVFLIVLNVTGLFILKGKHGISGRGKWLIAAGLLPIIIAFIVHELA